MLSSSLTLVAAFLPLLALTTANIHAPHPPHMRHRRIGDALNAREAEALAHAARSGAAVAPRDNEGHAQAKRLIKRSVKKRGQTCRPRTGPNTFLSAASSSSAAASSAVSQVPTSVSSAVSVAPSSSAAQASTAADWTTTSAADGSWATTTSSWESATTSQAAPPSNGGSNAGGVLSMTDAKCGYSNADSNSPNGVQGWLNCGIDGSGWTPPMIHADQLIAVDLTADGVFAPCGPYIDKFNQYAAQYGLKGIMLASFAMQESTCNPAATGGNGEAGLMQLASMNCHGAPGGNCYDVDFNIQRAAELFSNLINSNGGNIIIAIGSYNGWQADYTTIESATRAASQGQCRAQNNLDYIDQYCNAWLQGKSGYDRGTYFNLAHC